MAITSGLTHQQVADDLGIGLSSLGKRYSNLSTAEGWLYLVVIIDCAPAVSLAGSLATGSSEIFPSGH